MPRYMIIRKASATTEAGIMPDTPEVFEDMGAYMEEMAKAGILLGGDGLRPTREAKRVTIPRSGKPRVVDGPFTETKELIAGFWIWEVKSLQEAIEWVKKCPNPMRTESEIEIRQIFTAEDFGDSYTPELQERDDRLREEIERQAKT
jgi:hypothetical protein